MPAFPHGSFEGQYNHGGIEIPHLLDETKQSPVSIRYICWSCCWNIQYM